MQTNHPQANHIGDFPIVSTNRIVSIRAERAKRSKTFRTRIAWNGMSKEELQRPGALLIAALLRRANERGQQLNELASALGVTYGYIAQLRNGLRDVVHISSRFAQACARYLGVPAIAVKILAGQVSVTDFIFPVRPLGETLDAGLRRIETDELLGAMMPASVYMLDEQAKAFIVACYEQATTEEALPSRALPRLLLDLQHAALAQAEFEVEQARKSGD